MESKFQHSVKVPTQYKKAAKVLKNAMEQRGASLKTLIFSEKHAVNSVSRTLTHAIVNTLWCYFCFTIVHFIPIMLFAV